MTIRIVTDSTSDISQADAEKLGITVVPLNIHFGSEQLRDGVDILPQRFFERLVDSKALPKTSQPSAGAFLEVYQRLAQETDQILSVHISGKLSGTINSARAARDALGPRARVEVLDAETVSWPLGLAARAAHEAAENGAGMEECIARAKDALERTQLVFVLDTLEYLQKGGRIGRARAWIGQVFNIKPILTIRDGEIAPLERVRSRMRAEERIFELATADADPELLAVAHSSSPDEAARWVQRLRDTRPGVPVEMGWLGPVVGVYAGPNVLGMATVRRTASAAESDEAAEPERGAEAGTA
ncbi:MAG: DegV family protein [Dehalococcoidia bacterium]